MSAAIAAGLANTMLGSVFSNIQMKKQNELNMDNWREMNEYNKPVNQVKRLREAGLNPALMLQGNGLVGMANSQPSGASSVSPPSFGFDTASLVNEGIQRQKLTADIELAKSQAAKNNAEAAGQNLQNGWINESNKTQIQSLLSTLNLTDKQREQIQQTLDFNDATWNARIQAPNQELENLKMQGDLLKIQKALGDKQLSYYDREKVLQFAQAMASIKSLYASGALSYAQAKTQGYLQAQIMVDTAVKHEDARSKRGENNARESSDYWRKFVDNELFEQNNNNGWRKWTYELGKGFRNLAGGIIAPFSFNKK